MSRSTEAHYPYEIHITVMDVGRDEFIEACEQLKVKPVLLELQSQTNGILADAMTSSRIIGTFEDAQKEAMRISVHLRLHYRMCMPRYKIETVPWHPQAQDVTSRSKSQYMECHLQLKIPVDQIDSMSWRNLTNFCAGHKLHLSRNAFKRNVEEGVVIHMATLRDHVATPEEFSAQVEYIKQRLDVTLGLSTEKVEIEFAILDTNPSHDVKWMT